MEIKPFIDKHGLFPAAASVAVLIVALSIAYYLVIFLPSKGVELKPLLKQKDCTKEAIADVNWLVNSEQNIFGKARVVVALKNHPCLESYSLLIERASSLAEKERAQVESVDELVELEQNPEELSELEASFKEDIELFTAELESRASKELEKLWESLEE